ncbi:MAG: TonB-dependent receptor plug domain-containing protein [Gemmatimonadaceae bacterium]
MKTFAALLLVPSIAAAQSAPRDSSRLASVVITATRVETTVRAPVSATVLSGDSLRARGITHLADALRLVPGVSVAASSSFGSQASLFIRGGQGNYVRVLLDGVPLNEPGGAFDIGSLTLENIDRVEVVRGPASVLYGADAVTGVIQLFSRTAAGATRGSATVEGGSYGARDLSLTGGTSFHRVALNASASDRGSDGILAFNNNYRTRSAAASVRLFPDARTEATLSARWQHVVYHAPTESDGTVADHNAENTDHRLVVAFNGRRMLTSRVTATWNLASGENSPRSNDGPDNAGDTLGFYGFFSRGTVTRRSADLQLTARAGASQSVTLGVAASRDHERSSSRSLSEYGEDDGAFVAARNDRAAYLQAVGRVARRGSYQFGARLDDNSAFGTFRTLRLGAAWQLAGSWRVRGAVGSAFRAPSFFENFATGYVTGNPALVPERTRSSELGVEGVLAGVTVSVVGFRQRFADLIQYTSQTASPAAPNYVNIAGANADGIEAGLAAVLPASVRGRLSYTWTKTRVTDAGFDEGAGANLVLGQPLVRRPEHVARLELGRSLGARATLTAGASYTGRAADRDFSGWPAKPVMMPARTLVDLASMVRLSSPGARVPVHAQLRIDNLGGTKYQGIYGFAAPGRVIRAGITIGQQ